MYDGLKVCGARGPEFIAGLPLHYYLSRNDGLTFCVDNNGLTFRGIHDKYDKDDCDPGLPLHFYLNRWKNVDIDVVKMLVERYPQSLHNREMSTATPVQAAVANSSIDNLHEVLGYFFEFDPSTARIGADWRSLLYIACANRNMNVAVFQLIYNARPDAMRERDTSQDNKDFLPIHVLSMNNDLDDVTSVEILRIMLSVDSTLVRDGAWNDECVRYLPIHYAIERRKSIDFCRVLIDAYPECLREDDSVENEHLVSPPIHWACSDYGNHGGNVDALRYLLDRDPESIHLRDRHGLLPIHTASESGKNGAIEVLLTHDPNAAAKEDTQTHSLPLHFAIMRNRNFVCRNLYAVQTLFDAYPEAIFAKNSDGDTPFDLANEYGDVGSFLDEQHAYAKQARDKTAMTTADEKGWLPLHRALKIWAPLGSIKLLVRGNPAAVNVADKKGVFSLHIACEFCSLKVVQFLVELGGHVLDCLDANEDSAIHYACRGGNLGVVKYLLESYASLAASLAKANAKGELPIHLLCGARSVVKDRTYGSTYHRNVRDNPAYVEAIWLMLLANPEVMVAASEERGGTKRHRTS